MQSLTNNVSVESASPPVATGHQSGKRAGMWINRNSAVATSASWLLWLREKGTFEASLSKTGSGGVKSLPKMGTAIRRTSSAIVRAHATHRSAYSPGLRQHQTTPRNEGTLGVFSCSSHESVPTNAAQRGIVQEAKACSNAQDRQTWALSERGNGSSRC